MVKYDVHIIHAREDASFAIKLAKALEKRNISVQYGETVAASVCDMVNKHKGSALLSLVLISRALMGRSKSSSCGDSDLSDLCELIMAPVHVLHAVWLDNLTEDEVRVKYSERLARTPAMHAPSDTPESIAKKIQLKLAGTSKLQIDCLVGHHPKLQYISPKIDTYRSNTEMIQPLMDEETDFRDEEPPHTACDQIQLSSQENQQEQRPNLNEVDVFQRLKDAPLSQILSSDDESHERIVKRLDVYLDKLANWKDLAMLFGVDDSSISRMLASRQPTAELLLALAQLGVTVDQFCHAALDLGRLDITDDVMRALYRHAGLPVPYLRPRDSVEKV